MNDSAEKSAPWLLAVVAVLALGWLLRPKAPKAAATAASKVMPRKRRTIREVVAAALRDASGNDWVDYATVTAAQAEAIRARTKSAEDFTSWRRVLSASDVRHVLKRHAADAHPITADHFSRLPELLACPVEQRIEKRAGKIDVLISVVSDGGTLWVVEEVRRGRRKLALKSIYYPGKQKAASQ